MHVLKVGMLVLILDRSIFLTIHFLKVYATEENNASHVGADEKTFRKWVWFYAECIANLERNVVSAFEL